MGKFFEYIIQIYCILICVWIMTQFRKNLSYKSWNNLMVINSSRYSVEYDYLNLANRIYTTNLDLD